MDSNIPYDLTAFSSEQASMDSEVTDKDYWFSKFMSSVRMSGSLLILRFLNYLTN